MKIYNQLKHKIEVDDKFYKKVIITLSILIVLDAIMLYLVW